MDPSYLPLLGVVVGALLGGGAQILASRMQDRQRHRQWLRDRRAESCRDFVTVADDKLHALGDYFDFHYHDPWEPPDDYVLVVFNRAANVDFFGSDDATILAREASEALLHLLGSSLADSNDGYRSARHRIDAFRRQARNDLLDV